jgi:hypothetical protein
MEPAMKEGVLKSSLPTIVRAIHECLERWAEQGSFNGLLGMKAMTFLVSPSLPRRSCFPTILLHFAL